MHDFMGIARAGLGDMDGAIKDFAVQSGYSRALGCINMTTPSRRFTQPAG